MKVRFETTECSRCGGSGHYSFTPMYGTTCFKCSGSGTEMTRTGSKAHAIYEAAMTIPASEVKTGMVLFTDVKLSGRRTRETVETVGPSTTVSSTHADGTPVEYLELRFRDGKYGLHLFPHSPVRLAVTPDVYERVHLALDGLKGATIS